MRQLDSKTHEVEEGLDLVLDDCGHPYYVIVDTRSSSWEAPQIEQALRRAGYLVWLDTASWHHERDWSSALVHEEGFQENAMNRNARQYSKENVNDLFLKKSLAELRRMQELTVQQIQMASAQRRTDALEELQLREREIQQAINLKAFGESARRPEPPFDPEAQPFGPSGDRTRGIGSRHRKNAADYYVWPLGKGNMPLAGEGPFGPYALDNAKTTARIRATNGGHDYAVTRGSDPATFTVERVYQHASGERLSANAADAGDRKSHFRVFGRDGRPIGGEFSSHNAAVAWAKQHTPSFYTIHETDRYGHRLDSRPHYSQNGYDPTWGPIPDVRWGNKYSIGDAGAVYEFNVKMKRLRGVNIDDDTLYFEVEQALERFAEQLHSRYSWIGDVYLTGRSGGWLAIEDAKGKARQSTLRTISELVRTELNAFQNYLREKYGES